MRILTFSSLYPNPEQPHHGIFVEQRLRQLLSNFDLSSQVVAPVPWFPLDQDIFGEYGKYAKVPNTNSRHGIDILHPRYIHLPKIGMNTAPWLMAKCVDHALREKSEVLSQVDLIDAHYFYPDGVAAALLARKFNKPLVITSRGTDVNLIPQHSIPKRWILWAADQAKALITVCQALKDQLVELGVSDEKITVLRNGVDLDFFHQMDRESTRQRLGLGRKTILSVGHLIERKGHDRVIRALLEVPNADLLIVGTGEEDRALKKLALDLCVQDRVQFIGGVPQSELREYYSAADVLVLASSREGWPNVLLESMACGTPVVATPVWGSPEVVTKPEAGVLTEDRSPESIARAVLALFENYPERQATRSYAENFDWYETSQGQMHIFNAITSCPDKQ